MIKQPSQRDCSIYDFVVHQNKPISDTARMFGVSPSTVRRALDKYTEWKSQRRVDEALALQAIQPDELEQALVCLMEAFDALLPGARHIAVDVGLLNEAAVRARPLVEKIKARG